METNYFDPAKSIEGLAQFDQAAANSALTFSANFITQIDALAVSLQTISRRCIPRRDRPAADS